MCVCDVCLCRRVYLTPLLFKKKKKKIFPEDGNVNIIRIRAIESTVLSCTHIKSPISRILSLFFFPSLFPLSRKDLLVSVRHCDYLIFTRRSFASRPRYLTNTAVEKIVFLFACLFVCLLQRESQ